MKFLNLNKVLLGNHSMFLLEILPVVKASCPNLTGTLTNAFLVEIVCDLFIVMILDINNLTAFDPISIVAYFLISLKLSKLI